MAKFSDYFSGELFKKIHGAQFPLNFFLSDLGVVSRITVSGVDFECLKDWHFSVIKAFQISFSREQHFGHGRICKIAHHMRCLTVLFSRKQARARNVARGLEIFPISVGEKRRKTSVGRAIPLFERTAPQK
jgi:hypothetical protein